MNRQIYNTHMYLFNNCGCKTKKVFKASIKAYHFCSFVTIYFHIHTSPAKKVAHVMPRLACYMHACVHVVLIILI